MRWIFVPNTAEDDEPQWARSAALDDDDCVFIPAAIFGDENAVLLSAIFDDQSVLFDDERHAYVLADWAAQEFPDLANLCRLIERKTRAYFELAEGTNQCKLTECQGKPRCPQCLQLDLVYGAAEWKARSGIP